MHRATTLHPHVPPRSVPECLIFSGVLAVGILLVTGSSLAQSPAQPPSSAPAASHQATKAKSRAHHSVKNPAPEPVAQTPAPPPMPHWPINDSPNPPSVVWDSSGLRISASNSSLQQILNEVSTDTGSKVVGPIPDQRIFGSYGPGDARDVLSQLLQGSGYNVLLAGDIGKGAPSEIVLSPRRAGNTNAQSAINRPQQQDPDDEIPDQPEEEPQPQVQQPQQPGDMRPGFGPNGPMRTPQQVMEEMQQRQLLQQQQLQQQIQQQQQMQQQNPQ